ncbi:MAG: DUF1559 domain-containing protein [Planctomycetaceae bacterium]|nr:DUF1559 domain-containing protein [Planctomycetaceae bacterium]
MKKRRENWGPSRCGISLVEILVSVSIIALLIAMLLPAVQSVRESARKSTCQNHLKQIALGCEQFESVHGHYPTSQLFEQHGVGPDGTTWSFLAQLLPHLEQSNLHTEGGIPEKTLRESGIADRQVAVFLCPSDPHSNTGPRLDAGNMYEVDFAVGQTNYKGVCGSNWGADISQGWSATDSGTRWPNPSRTGSFDGLNEGDGLFSRVDWKRPRSKDRIIDGTSSTMMLGEALPKYDTYCSWPYANNVHSTCAIPPNIKDDTNPQDWPNTQSFRSEHVGGLHFAFADGSVHFINESIDLTVYRSLATIAGNEVTGFSD